VRGSLRICPVLWRGALIVAALLVVPSSARAELQIVESNTPDYPVGKVLPDDTKFELGVGCHVRVLKLPSNETRRIDGPALGQKPVAGTRGKPPPLSC